MTKGSAKTGWCMSGQHGPGPGTTGCPGLIGDRVCPCECHTPIEGTPA